MWQIDFTVSNFAQCLLTSSSIESFRLQSVSVSWAISSNCACRPFQVAWFTPSTNWSSPASCSAHSPFWLDSSVFDWQCLPPSFLALVELGATRPIHSPCPSICDAKFWVYLIRFRFRQLSRPKASFPALQPPFRAAKFRFGALLDSEILPAPRKFAANFGTSSGNQPHFLA